MDNDQSETVTLSRKELYEKIWQTPTTKLGESFGLSDVALGKICKKHLIPKPPLGYWAKLAHGKLVTQTPLSTIDNPGLEVIKIGKKTPHSTIERVKSSTSMNEVQLVVPERLTSPHPLVRWTMDALKSEVADQTGILRAGIDGCLNVSVGRQSVGRAMRIMNALIKALESQGSTVTVVKKDRMRQTCVNILDETLEIELKEILTRKEKQFTAAQLRDREKSYWLRDRKEYEFFPSQNFALNIVTYCGEGVRRVWSDGKRQRLENCLGSVIVGLRAAAEGVRAVRLERECWERERQENERRRLEEQERRRKEEEKIKHLEQVVANWNQSQKIREFVANVERAIAEAKERNNKVPDLSEWLAWAYRYADSIDPIHLTLLSDGALDNDTES
jgi:hypothetical protein